MVSEITLDEMRKKSNSLRSKYFNYVPIIVERHGTNIEAVDKTKFLVPIDFTVSQFVFVLRKRLKLSSDKALFVFLCDNVFPSTSSSIGELDEKYKGGDGFLRIKYCGENAFGV